MNRYISIYLHCTLYLSVSLCFFLSLCLSLSLCVSLSLSLSLVTLCVYLCVCVCVYVHMHTWAWREREDGKWWGRMRQKRSRQKCRVGDRTHWRIQERKVGKKKGRLGKEEKKKWGYIYIWFCTWCQYAKHSNDAILNWAGHSYARVWKNIASVCCNSLMSYPGKWLEVKTYPIIQPCPTSLPILHRRKSPLRRNSQQLHIYSHWTFLGNGEKGMRRRGMGP